MVNLRRHLYITVFFSGMTTLAMEFAASRLLGSVFGTSNLVWASIIGLILIYLTVGYFLGGVWADRSPYPRTMYRILAWGAFFSGIIPLVSRPVLRLAAGAFDQLQIGVLFGSFTAVLILFSIPVTLLGTISPFAIRLAIDDPQHAGTISGRIYAVSTLGSFLGTFLAVLSHDPADRDDVDLYPVQRAASDRCSVGCLDKSGLESSAPPGLDADRSAWRWA